MSRRKLKEGDCPVKAEASTPRVRVGVSPKYAPCTETEPETIRAFSDQTWLSPLYYVPRTVVGGKDSHKTLIIMTATDI